MYFLKLRTNWISFLGQENFSIELFCKTEIHFIQRISLIINFVFIQIDTRSEITLLYFLYAPSKNI